VIHHRLNPILLPLLTALPVALTSCPSAGRAAPSPDPPGGVMCPPPLHWPGRACPAPGPRNPGAPLENALGQRIAEVRQDLDALADQLRQQIHALEDSVKQLNRDLQGRPVAGPPGERGPQGPAGPAGDTAALLARITELQAKLDDRDRQYGQQIAALRQQIGNFSGPLRVRIEPATK
jgi:hypothetical protein